MDEPTEEQLKQLHKDIMSGLVMIVEVEHYRRLTDNLNKSYDANKQQAGRIKEFEEELDAECRVSQMLLAGKKKLKKRIEELEAENKQLEKNAKEDLKEIERLRTLASQLCEERNKVLGIP